MASKKLDGTLAARVQALENLTADAAESARRDRVKALVHVIGDIHAVERAGLWTELNAGQIAVGTIAVGDLDRVADLDDVASIESDRPGCYAVHDSAKEIRTDQARAVPPGFDGSGVVVGIVDGGIDIFHHSFRNPDGSTRIVSLLDLNLRQTIVMSDVTSGVFSVNWQPPALQPGAAPPKETTPQLNLPVTAGQLQAALEAFNAIDPGDVAVTGGPLPGTPIAVDWTGRYADAKFDNSKIPRFGIVGTVNGPPGRKAAVEFGREFRAPEINAALQSGTFASRDADGHGTHVAGIAAGDGSQPGNCEGENYYVGIAPKADIAVVRWTGVVTDILRGAKHVLGQPWRPQGQAPKPTVVNLSIGNTIGPHDGTHNLEIGLDTMLAGTTKQAVVVAAGNGGRIVDPAHPELDAPPGGGMHTFKQVPKNGTTTFELVIQAEDRDLNGFEIWYAGAGRLSFSLRTPPGVGGPAGAVLPEVAPSATPSPAAAQLAGHPVTVWSTLGNQPSNKHSIEVRIIPGLDGTIAPGTWTITLRETQGTATDFDCWIGVAPTKPRAFIRQDQQVRTRTIITPGNAANVITVGAYDSKSGALAEFSSRGPATDSTLRVKPDLCAPGAGIFSARSGERGSSIWCDRCCDFYVAKQGTSQAAPHVAGVVALMLQAKPDLSFAQIADILRSTSRPPDPPVSTPSNEWGAGKVDAEKAVLAAKAAVTTISGATAPADRLAGDSDPEEPVLLPSAAYPDAHLPIHVRLREMQRRAEGSPLGQLLAALISEHLDEVGRLVNSERRVLVAWHRMNGPLLLRRVLGDVHRDVLIPRMFGGRPVADGLAGLLDELACAGSPALRADIARYRALLLTLPGASLSGLDRRVG